jgi:hypothetical protein
MSELNDSQPICAKEWGPRVHGERHWAIKELDREG